MTDEDRKRLYTSLLRGIANEAQDRLCAADMQHAWGPVHRFEIRPDYVPIPPISSEAPIKDMACKIGAERTCQNCGKVERLS